MKVFDSVPVKVPAKNVFNLSHDVKASYNFDNLYPFLCQMVYPGDTWNVRAEALLRAMPMLAPVMHNVDMHLYFFFVPFRLLWNADKKHDWKTFITGGEDGLYGPDANDPTKVVTMPYVTYSQIYNEDVEFCQHRSLLDHMGFPTIDPSTSPMANGAVKISTLPFRAYQCVYNEYFRNQNLQNEIDFSYGMGNELPADIVKLFTMRKKNYEKDYFTSCLPWAQRGVAMTLPISGSAQNVNIPVSVNNGKFNNDEVSYGLAAFGSAQTGPNVQVNCGYQATIGTPITLEGQATGSITLTGLSIGTINDFRYNLRLQQWLENNARCGSRYIEQLFSHFGVRSSDARLQRPELLGGGKIPLIFTDVPQTSFGQGSSDNVLGDLAGKGFLYGKTGGFKKYFEEHGVLLGLCCMIPRTSYSQGISRQWTAFDKTDFYFPEFAHLGEQAVLNKELYYNPMTPGSHLGEDGPDDVFGYQGRFTELRYIPSSVHGEMRSDLQYWHLGRLFPSMPALNSDFITADTRANVFALSDIVESGYDPFVCQMHLDIKAVRPMPKYAVPTL